MNDTRILNTLKTNNATLVVLVLALCAQIPHAADVFRLIPYTLSGAEQSAPSWWQYIHGYLFAVALELAVLLFVVRGHQRESYGFAVVSVAMNLAYYNLHGVWLFAVSAIPAWLVSVSLPAAIALYSHAVADGEVEPEQPPAQPRAVKTVRRSEHTEQIAVYAEQLPEQSVVVDAEQSTEPELTDDEQKKQYLSELLASGRPWNKSKFAKTYKIGRTTLYAWLAELQPEAVQ